MKKNFVEELRWRGMIHDITPGTEQQLNSEMTAGYIGFDPTADSLHIGNLVQIMTLVHFQEAGHKPVALVGGATGMVGDPSGKSAERNLLSEAQLNHNLKGVKSQLEKFLNFKDGINKAELVNNYDWFKDIHFLDFIRENGNLFRLLLGERQGASVVFRKAIYSEMDRFISELAIDLERLQQSTGKQLRDPSLAAEAIVAVVFTVGA